MQLLAIDTATESCGIGLAIDGRIQVELSLSSGQTHAKQLMAGIQAVLSLAGTTLQTLDAFAVTCGPGSFTGLRIGISTVKGMALALGKPLVGVSSLEALAHQADGTEELICPMIDARRREVYWSLYRRTAAGIDQIKPEQVGPAELAVLSLNKACLFIGNGAHAYQTILAEKIDHQARWASKPNAVISAGEVARLAWGRLVQGHSDDVRTLGPVYLRQSDAELNFDGSSASGAAARLG